MDKEKSEKSGITLNRLRHIFLGIVLLLTGIWFGMGLESDPEIEEIDFPSATIYEIPVTLPQFTLTDHNGKKFNQWNLARKWTFMFFGYTFCPDVCPVALVDLNDIYHNLVEKGDLDEKKFKVNTQVVFVTVDPGRDTVEELKEYMPHFNEAFIGVTGSKEEIDSLARPMGVAYRRVPGEDSEGDYLVDHSASFMLIDPLGRLRASFSPPHDPKQIAEDFRNIRSEYTAECCITSDQEFKTVIFDYREEKK
jgi:protein SCO1/2